MNYSTFSPSLQRLSKAEADWIRYRLKRKNLRYADVAKKSGQGLSTVCNVMACISSNADVYNALWTMLGYSSFAAMLKDARRMSA